MSKLNSRAGSVPICLRILSKQDLRVPDSCGRECPSKPRKCSAGQHNPDIVRNFDLGNLFVGQLDTLDSGFGWPLNEGESPDNEGIYK